MSQPAPLEIFVRCLKNVPDPRSKQGTSHPFPTILAVVLFGLLSNVSTPTEIARWTKNHLSQLKSFLRFRKTGAPSRTTITRTLRKLSLDDLQAVFAEFLNGILDDSPIAAAVDGCEPHEQIASGPSGSRFELTLFHGDREAGSNPAVRHGPQRFCTKLETSSCQLVGSRRASARRAFGAAAPLH